MATTWTCTGLEDEIISLNKVDEDYIEVEFKAHGCFKVGRIMDNTTFEELKDMKVGQKIWVATRNGRLMWVKP